MKRFITIISSVILATTLSAQEIESVPEFVKKLHLNRAPSMSQSNYGDGFINIGSHFQFDYTEPCSCPGYGENSKDGREKSNEHKGDCIESVCSYLNKLVKISDDSYHFETHAKDKDTVVYSICIKNTKDEVKRNAQYASYGPGTCITLYSYPDAEEQVNLIWFSNFKKCNKHKWSHGDFNYTCRKPIPKEECTAFDQKTFLATILPVLKQKEIKSWDFNWTLDETYDNDEKYNKDFNGGITYSGVNGKMSRAGKTTGTMYLIPIKNKEMAEKVFNTIDSLTLAHINKYPNQKYSYDYCQADVIMSSSNEAGISPVLKEIGNLDNQFHLDFGISADGYYIIVYNTKRSYSYPKEWYKLKSYINGKKEYRK